jgi:dTDP-4-dehydrorhamnose 3,5-epimerase-like enzyme
MKVVNGTGPEPYLRVMEERRETTPGRRVTDQRAHLRVGQTGCRIVELPKVQDPRGNLTFVESNAHIPFDIQRVYYLYDVPGGESRGGHAHKQLQQLIIAASGSLDVLVDDGVHRERFFLNRSYYGLYIPPMIWRELDDFSSGSVCLVLASTPYDADDYYYDYDEFLLDAGARRAA